MLERSGDEEQVAKLKKDLKRTKALLKDAQLMLEKSQNEGTNKVIMRQLKNQVTDAAVLKYSIISFLVSSMSLVEVSHSRVVIKGSVLSSVLCGR